MNETRRIALEFALRLLRAGDADDLIAAARKIEAYFTDDDRKILTAEEADRKIHTSKTIFGAGSVLPQESREKLSEDRCLVSCDRIWFAPVTYASCLMIETRSPFVSVEGFQAALWLGDCEYVAHFEFAGAVTFKGETLTSMHFRATKLTSVPTGYQSLPVPKSVLSGPDLPRSAGHV